MDLAELNHKVSLYTAYYELPTKIDEFYEKYNINLNYEEVFEQFASEDFKRLSMLLKKDPVTEEEFYMNYYNSKNEL